MTCPSHCVGAVVLAAGRSSRMGANKLIQDLHGRPVIAHVLDAIAAAGLPPPLVVLGHDRDAVLEGIGKRAIRAVDAPDFADGMGRSIAAGFAAAPQDWAAALLCLGDMPLLSPALLAQMASRASPSGIVIPVHGGRRGHPVCWGRAYFPELALLQGDVGARHILGLHRARISEIAADAGVHLDVDTFDALDALRNDVP